ncbi:hypothetical protein CXB51_016553 [Gossypium anomalum]|uniref:Reverse transcriptase domain-containing protein n=1 Tax=Gossypium anomalum TaxID=47600 RepID=A0A8J6CXP7_9ROSI|nr:hypothetical protein CXB51_016553 [Gossypium anomalum]
MNEEMLQLVLKHFEHLFTASSPGEDARLLGMVEKQISNVIAYEVLHSLKMKKRGRKGNFTLKLDMSKVHDRVEWNFLARIMSHIGFHSDWVVLIMRCVCSVSYTVGINGESSKRFSPLRGLRLGDPLSPYLFLLCAEGFSTLLHNAKQEHLMQGALIGREKLSINHLLFADDCILFGDASEEGTNMMRNLISEYEQASGQRVNFEKSLICFGANVELRLKELVTGIFGVRVATNPKNYLRLPMMIGRKKWAFAHFVDQFRKRIEGASPYLNCFVASWKVLKARYSPLTNIFSAKVGTYSSFTWRSICSARKLIADGLVWRIGNGNSVNIWKDPWLPGHDNNRLSVQNINTSWTTADHLIDAKTNTWKKEVIRSLFDEEQSNRIFSIPLACRRSQDMLVWKFEASGNYSVKSGYRTLITDHLKTSSYNGYKDDKYRDFYKILWERLSADVVCPLCKEAPEDSDHLLWKCGIVRQLWVSLNVSSVQKDFTSHGRDNFINKFIEADVTILARNNEGQCLGACTYPFGDVVDAVVTKVRACEKAMLFAADLG